MKSLFYLLLLGFIISYSARAQVTFSPEVLEKHVSLLASDSLEGRGFGTNEMARSYIINQYKEAGLKMLNDSYVDTFTARVGILRIEGNNIVGFIQGNDPEFKNEYIILGAHYDHLGYKIENGNKVVYNGADDNASGTAAIIEIGKQLVKNQQKLKRSVIIVAFDGEESGLHGSKQFIKNEVVDVSKVKLMFSLDMVGMYSKNNGVGLHGIASLDNFESILTQVKGDVKISNKGKNIENRTDTQPFGKEGIPAIHVFTGTKSPYHKPEDDSDLLDYDGMAKVCSLIYRFTVEASHTDNLTPIPSITAEAEKKDTAVLITGLRINTGSNYHFYKEQFFQGKSLFAAEAGLFAQVRLGKHLRIQPEVVYELKGSESGNGDIRMHAVTMPLNLMLTTGDPVGFNPMAFLIAGGYYSYNFAGKIGDDDIDFDKEFEPGEYGFTFGVGVQIQRIQMGFYSKYGLTEIAKENPAGEILNRSSYFSFGLLF